MRAPGTQPSRPDVRALVEAHQAGVWRYLRFLGCDRSEADDLCQDTFLSVLRSPFRDLGDPAAASYLRRVARSLFLKSRRRSSRRPRLEDLDRAEQVWSRLVGDGDGGRYVDALRTCLTELAGRARRALELRHVDGCSREQIAQELGIGPDGAKSLLQRTRRSLRNCIERRLSR